MARCPKCASRTYRPRGEARYRCKRHGTVFNQAEINERTGTCVKRMASPNLHVCPRYELQGRTNSDGATGS